MVLAAPITAAIKILCENIEVTKPFALLLAGQIEELVSGVRGGGDGQGLTLVHFSAQPEPYLTQTHTLNTSQYPRAPLYNPYKHPLSHRKR